MWVVYRVSWWAYGEDEYGYPRSFKKEKFFSTEEKAKDFIDKNLVGVWHSLDEIEVEG